MNKAILKTYFNKENDRTGKILRDKTFKYDNKYLISDKYSIVCLNDNYGLEISKDTLGINRIYENFINNYEIGSTFMTIDTKEDFEPITKDYSIQMKQFRRINKLIKSNTYAILYNINKKDDVPIVRLENSKTKETAYLLACRTF
jgi:hypothetical protein